MNNITITWESDEGAYIVRQSGEFIGDFVSLEEAGSFAVDVAGNAGTYVELISVQS